MYTNKIRYIVNAKAILPNRKKSCLCKVIKIQLFSVEKGILHHVIGNIYYTIDTNIILNNVVELPGKCLIKKY